MALPWLACVTGHLDRVPEVFKAVGFAKDAKRARQMLGGWLGSVAVPGRAVSMIANAVVEVRLRLWGGVSSSHRGVGAADALTT
jgi:hypothetical protein